MFLDILLKIFEPEYIYSQISPLLIASTIPALMQAGVGIWQMNKARKLAEAERPEYEIPQSEKDALSIAQQLATQRELPGQGAMEENIRANTASGISRMSEVADSPAMLLGNIATMTNKENQALNQLGISAANYYAQNQRNLQGALSRMGQQELAKWQYDEMKPYEEAMQAAAMMREGGLQNIVGGAKSGISNAIAIGQNKEIREQNKDFLDAYKEYFKGLKGLSNVDTKAIETDLSNEGLSLVNDFTNKLLLSIKDPTKAMQEILYGNKHPENTGLNVTSLMNNNVSNDLLNKSLTSVEPSKAVEDMIYGGGAGSGAAMGEISKAVELTKEEAETFSNDELYEKLKMTSNNIYWVRDRSENLDGKSPDEVSFLSKEEALKLLEDPEERKRAIEELVKQWNEYRILYQMLWDER